MNDRQKLFAAVLAVVASSLTTVVSSGADAAQADRRGASKPLEGVKAVRLSQHPQREAIAQAVGRRMSGQQIRLSLIPLKTYMVNNCLGIRASAGEFMVRPANPRVEFRDSGVWLQLSVDRVSINALTIRIRPNPTNLAEPCTFGKRFSIGGSASNLRLELTFDPVLNMQQCKVANPGRVGVKWRIGGLNLKPLQNDLDRVAKNMIEDTLTYGSNFNHSDQIIRNIDDALEADCPG